VTEAEQIMQQIVAWLEAQAAAERDLLDSPKCRPDAQKRVNERWMVYKAVAQEVRRAAWAKIDRRQSAPLSDGMFTAFVERNREFGYGRMMQIISGLWQQKDPRGALSVGDTYGMLERRSRRARRPRRHDPGRLQLPLQPLRRDLRDQGFRCRAPPDPAVLPTAQEAFVTPEEYRRICDRIVRKALRYAKEVADPNPKPDNVTSAKEHWIDVYLDVAGMSHEHLPDMDADAVLEMTSHADAFEKAAGHPAASREAKAHHALQADVWDAVNRPEDA